VAERVRYVQDRPELKVVIFMTFRVGHVRIQFSIFIATISVTAFQAGRARSDD
jgi:hypothetical protein